MNNKKIIIFFILLLNSITLIFSATNLSQYEYITKININCEEYKGYVKVELPQEYLSIKNPKSYFNEKEYFIDKGYQITNYINQNFWYIKNTNNSKVNEIENIYDKNQNTYMLFQNNNAKFTFTNPNFYQIDKIKIKAIDSQIEKIKLYTTSNEEIQYKLRQNNFDYEIFLDKTYNINEIKFDITFKDILKLNEITFYKKEQTNERTYLYFYLNNQCQKDFTFYFGEFGTNYKTYTKNVNIPIEFPIAIKTNQNQLYNYDFDNDTITNKDDNCPTISNTNQKDINYNNIGDACEDSDRDKIVDANDNCPNKYNRDQLDNDNDKIGNVCDTEDDRFFEKNIIFIYILVVIIAVIFIGLSFKIMKPEKNKKEK